MEEYFPVEPIQQRVPVPLWDLIGVSFWTITWSSFVSASNSNMIPFLLGSCGTCTDVLSFSGREGRRLEPGSSGRESCVSDGGKRWRAVVLDRVLGTERTIDGHVEIRWSHGRFSGVPEAKVHLDSHPHTVAGYEPLS